MIYVERNWRHVKGLISDPFGKYNSQLLSKVKMVRQNANIICRLNSFHFFYMQCKQRRPNSLLCHSHPRKASIFAIVSRRRKLDSSFRAVMPPPRGASLAGFLLLSVGFRWLSQKHFLRPGRSSARPIFP